MRQPWTHERTLFAAWCLVATVAFSAGGAQLWAKLADPPSATLTSQGVFFGEVELNQQSGVTLWFFVVGVGLGVVVGLLTGLLGRNLGVVAVVSSLVICAVVSVSSARLGISVLGPDEQAQLAATTLGGSVTAKLAVSSFVAYLGWPIGGLVGVLAAVSCWPRREELPRADSGGGSVFGLADRRGDDDVEHDST